MLLKKLYVQNQELTEKLSKAQNKISEMDKDYRVLQKQHLLLQHNIQNKLIGKLFIYIDFSYYPLYQFIATRLSQVSQKTLGFRDVTRRNSFDKFIETQAIRDEVSSFWGELRKSTNNYLNTESIDEDLARRISNVFQSEHLHTETVIDADDATRRKDTS
jgi:hypothetical protein